MTDSGAATDEAIEEAKVRVLRLAARFLLVAPALYLAVLFGFYPEHAHRAFGPALILSLAAAALLILRSGKAAPAARLLIYGGWVGLALAAATGGGVHAPQMVALPLAVLICGWILGPRQAVLIAALSIALALVLTLAAEFGYLPQPVPAPAILVWIPITVVVVLVCLLTWYIVGGYESRLAEVRRLGAELTRRVEELAAEKSQLHLIAENVPAMIFHGGPDMRCRYANRQFADFFHGGGVPLEGMHLREILGSEVFEAALPNIERVLAGESVLIAGERQSKAEGVRHLEINLVPERVGGVVAGFYALKRDVTERQRAELALSESEAQLRLVTENVPAMIAYNDREMVLRYANRRYLDFFGLHGPSVIGRHILNIIGEKDFRKVAPLLRRAIDGAAISYRAVRRSAAGEDRMVEVEVVPDRGADGEVRGSYALMRDITDQQRAEDEVRRLNAELESRVRERTAELTAANRELESFAYSISHDLRAPLRGIDGFSQLLVEEYRERLDAQGIDYLDRVRRAAQRMGTLIDDILELSRVTRQEMRRVRVDLSQIAAELIEERSRAEPQHRVDVTLAPGCSAIGDPQLLRVMMQNLLENAWKYSAREAEPRVEFGCAAENGERIFYVRDNGVGFDMQYAGRLFAPFQRLHSPEEFEGTGIGLATVARVVNRHGGRVWAESFPGEGAIFRFTLGPSSGETS